MDLFNTFSDPFFYHILATLLNLSGFQPRRHPVRLMRHLMTKFPESLDCGPIHSAFIPTPLPPLQRWAGWAFRDFSYKREHP